MLLEIESVALARLLRESIWAYPALEIVHLIALAVMVGSVFLVEMRALGAQRRVPLPELGHLSVKIGGVAFVFVAASGALMFMTNATEFGVMPLFWAKLALIGAAGLNLLLFHARQSLQKDDGVTKGQAVLSLLLWFAVIAAGRLIAYV